MSFSRRCLPCIDPIRRPHRDRAWVHVAVVALAFVGPAGCYTGLADVSDASVADDGDGPHGTDTGDGAPPAASEQVAAIGLRRLTAHEYDDVLADLLLDDTRESQLLLPTDLRTPFDNDYTLQEPSLALIEGADLLAADAAARFVGDPGKRAAVVGCVPTGADDEACFRSFVTAFGRRAFRRPLGDAEIEGYVALQSDAIIRNDFWVGVESVVRAMLQAPSFLYRVEIGTPVPDDPSLFQLTGYEVATRLSFLLWGSIPDDDLLDLAGSGALDQAEGVRDAARQMLADPRAVDRVARFHALWLGYETLPHAADLTAAMQAETRALVQRVVIDEQRPWRDLLQLDETWIDAALAEHYGLPAPDGDGAQWVAYGDSGRKGILAHGSFLSANPAAGDTSPTLRGRGISENLLCRSVPPPPPSVNTDAAPPGFEPGVDCKARKHEMYMSTPGCANCHLDMDGIGLGLENYDAQGRWRAHEDGREDCVIVGDGEIPGIGDFSGPAELADLLVASQRLDACVTRQLYRYAIGRSELRPEDERVLTALGDALGDGELRFDELIVEFVQADMFRFRRHEEV